MTNTQIPNSNKQRFSSPFAVNQYLVIENCFFFWLLIIVFLFGYCNLIIGK